MPTYGEKLVGKLLDSLPRNKYHIIAEPTIPTEDSAYRKPDFVVISALLGVIVVEVKDWVTVKRATQRETHVIERNGKERTDSNPLYVAEQYAQNLALRLESEPRLVDLHRKRKRLKFPWEHVVIFPNLDFNDIRQVVEGGVWEQGRVITRSQLTSSENLEKAFSNIPFHWKLPRSLKSSDLDLIRATVDPEIIIPDKEDPEHQAVGVETMRQTYMIREPLRLPMADLLTDEATKVAEAENFTVRLVRGVAGSGKTLVLARRAQYLAQHYPKSRILVMAFNKDLIGDIKSRIPTTTGVEINNFHQVCYQIIRRRLRNRTIHSISDWVGDAASNLIKTGGFDADFVAQEIEWRKELEIYDSDVYLEAPREGRGRALNRDKRNFINKVFDSYMTYHREREIVDWADVPHMALSELLQGHPMRHTYDVILIDEAQDFAPSWIKVVKRLLKPTGELFMCDDPAQCLFRAFSWRQKGVEVVGRTRILRVPFRCTKEITLAAHSLLSGDGASEELVQPDLEAYELASGDKPTIINCRDLNQEIKLIEQIALSFTGSDIPSNQVAILCHNRHFVRHWAHLRNQGFYVETFNKMKGLEFRAVLIPHLHTAFDSPGTKDDAFVAEMRRKIFTAMTRAREILMLSYHGNFPPEFASIELHVQRQNGEFFEQNTQNTMR